VRPRCQSSLDAAAVVAELVALAKQLKHEHERGTEFGLRDDELALYDAICQNDSAVLEMGDDTLKRIARELVESVRGNATLDWNDKQQVRARMRATIRRLLNRYGYPPGKQPAAIELVVQQAAALAQAA
jgi:type I restriction enzyme R subunit